MAEIKIEGRKYTLKEYVKMSLGLPVYIGDVLRDGWSQPIPHYAFKCPVHGIVVDYPHHHSQTLDCPKCRANAYPSKEHEGL